MTDLNQAPADLGDFMPTETAVYEVLAADGIKSTGWKIEFSGPSHPQTLQWTEENTRRMMRKDQMIEQARVNGRKFKSEERDPADLRRENVSWVVSRILSWTPIKIAIISDDPITFSKEAAISLFMRPDMGWVFSQLVDFLVSERTFTKASAPN